MGYPSSSRLRCSRRAHFDACAAACAFFPFHVWAHLRVHALLLRPGGETHGDVLDGSSENRSHMPFKMRKDYETVCFLHNGSDLSRLKMLETGGYICNVSPFGTIRYYHRASEKFFCVAVFVGGLQGIAGCAAASRVKRRSIEDKGLRTLFAEPLHNLPGDNRAAGSCDCLSLPSAV